ncbi:DUF3168 domain-containing protein [Chthonobacter albigriseus]|uniref:DUF3168 domain-containing protein n=1 Tax=Chthonobacter albigriseus TaxID=1683161 RepID=UPI0015EF334A|nr:DUF3168 domain-containing protein [Chthonobacter albigriseus]
MTRPTAALAEVQTAIRSALKADAALGTLVQGRIHDGPPKTSVTPWLSIGEGRTLNWGHGDAEGARLQLTLEALATDDDRSRVLAIADRAAAVVEGANLAVPGGTVVLVRLGAARVERLRDGRTWRARLAVDVLIDG